MTGTHREICRDRLMLTWNCVPITFGGFRDGLLDRGLDLWWRPLGGGNGDFSRNAFGHW